MSVSKKLLRCPFCGARADIERSTASPYGPTWHVGCTNGSWSKADNYPTLESCIGYHLFDTMFAARRFAVEAWNKRAGN